MVNEMKRKTDAIVGIGMMTAVIIVLQAFALSIRVGIFSITLVLAPIIVGTALYGYLAGAYLGLVFGVVVLLTDAGAFLAVNVPGTIITCLLKGILAGLISGIVFKALEPKGTTLASIAAGVVAPVVNTGVFLIGCRIFFFDTIAGWAEAAGAKSAGVFMLTSFVGVNFIVELVVNLVLSTAIVRIIKIAKKNSN